MKIDLSELNLEKSREFLEYFNASLRAKKDLPMPGSGSGSFTDEGHLALLDDWIKTADDKTIPVTWHILQTQEGLVKSIEVVPEIDNHSSQLETIASKFVTDILVSVLSGKEEDFYKRSYFSAISGSNLLGEYWLPGYRLAPQFPNDISKIIFSERYLVIDQEVKAIDAWHANAIADERATLAAAHLSLITNVGLFKPIHENRWFLRKENDELKQFRESTQHIDLNCPGRMPKKGELCDPVKFEGSVFDHVRMANNEFSCPTETRKILRGLNSANPAYQTAFNNCARLYQLALTVGSHYPTVMISYEFASIEAIVQVFKDDFSCFSDFVTKNINENVEYLLDIIHGKIRSAHWHAGHFALGETDHRQDFLTNPQEHIRFNIIRESHRVIRTSIFNWVIENIADAST